jgi:hypothetical protein
MREERMNNDQDPALQTPQDANMGKHVNFLEDDAENKGSNAPSGNPIQERWEEMSGETKNNDKYPN